MALYLISYDIPAKNENDYQLLWDLLSKLGGTRILYSQWVILSDYQSASDLCEQIKPLLHDGDGLLVNAIVTGTCNWNNVRISDDDFTALLLND
jgi:hypothetical protein